MKISKLLIVHQELIQQQKEKYPHTTNDLIETVESHPSVFSMTLQDCASLWFIIYPNEPFDFVTFIEVMEIAR